MHRFVVNTDDKICRAILVNIYITADINECETKNVCEQLCNNFDGGYSCDCNSGYTLAQDGSSCSGKQNIEDMSETTKLTLR